VSHHDAHENAHLDYMLSQLKKSQKLRWPLAYKPVRATVDLFRF
jgi:hypothetical protein